ncbi:pyrazinamidase/nicotinamidase-like protein [Tirmania nivea]|nr:pyrazinamidase/nicotinamidase-like protein [Tirmania nivea]
MTTAPAPSPAPPTPFTPALLLIDLQVDFSPSHPTSPDPPGTLAVPSAPAIIPPILRLLSLPFPLKLFSKDSHPPNHISFASNHPPPHNIPFTSFTRICNPSNPAETLLTRLWPPHCIRSTPGWEFISEIRDWLRAHPDEPTAVVEKGQHPDIETYSAFRDPFPPSPSHKPVTSDPPLEPLLRHHKITDVYVAGLAGDYCVKETVLHCAELGFRTWVVREGVASVDEGEKGWGEAKRRMGEAGARMVGIDGVEVGWIKALAAQRGDGEKESEDGMVEGDGD